MLELVSVSTVFLVHRVCAEAQEKDEFVLVWVPKYDVSI